MKTSKIGKQYTSGVRPWLKNVACLSSLIALFLMTSFLFYVSLEISVLNYDETEVTSRVCVASFLSHGMDAHGMLSTKL